MPHYFRPSRRKTPRMIISDNLRGVTVEFYVTADVFSPKGVDEGTRLLIEHARVPEEGVILDLGCGYGAIGITLAKAFPRLRVFMVDINPKAVKLARMNAELNNVSDRVVVLEGDLYEPVKDLVFDAVISNPPLAAGSKTVERIITEAPSHLRDGGSLQLVMKKGASRALDLMKKAFGRAEVLLRKKGYTVLYAEKGP
ncbi:class I SAM-dependent methyltransferase [Pyrofollis japonicus]|uniref:class I SAM-dependent methyltransferase n=1 Tax=Pyrofollis japonicus TaxID=3060460 RepID=UPI0037C6B7CE